MSSPMRAIRSSRWSMPSTPTRGRTRSTCRSASTSTTRAASRCCDSVRAAETRLLAQAGAKPYLPMEGAADARRAVQALLFGPAHEALAAGRVATIQSVGSSGGLKVGADFLQALVPVQRRVDQRPELGQPPLDVRGQRLHGEHLPVLRLGQRRRALCRHAGGDRSAARAQHRAAARLLPQPDRRRPHARAVGPVDSGAQAPRADRLPGPGLPGLWRRHRRRRLRGARDGQLGRGLRGGELVLQEHERVRRALRRAVDRVPDGARGRAGARATQAHGAPHLLQPRDPRRRHHGAGARRPAAARRSGSARSRRCASASARCARRCTRC